MEQKSEPVACSLTKKQARSQLQEWRDLQSISLGIERLDDGVRMRLPASVEADLADLARREAACCTFLSISTTRASDAEIIVEITSAVPDALPVIHGLSGLTTE